MIDLTGWDRSSDHDQLNDCPMRVKLLVRRWKVHTITSVLDFVYILQDFQTATKSQAFLQNVRDLIVIFHFLVVQKVLDDSAKQDL